MERNFFKIGSEVPMQNTVGQILFYPLFCHKSKMVSNPQYTHLRRKHRFYSKYFSVGAVNI